MDTTLLFFLGFLGALLASVGVWRAQLSRPGGMAIAALGSALLFIITLAFLLILIGVAKPV